MDRERASARQASLVRADRKRASAGRPASFARIASGLGSAGQPSFATDCERTTASAEFVAPSPEAELVAL